MAGATHLCGDQIKQNHHLIGETRGTVHVCGKQRQTKYCPSRENIGSYQHFMHHHQSAILGLVLPQARISSLLFLPLRFVVIISLFA